MKEFTLLIPTLNESYNLRILFRQLIPYKDLIKILLVDDSSQDEFKILNKLISKFLDLDIRTLKGYKKGIGTAIRQGLNYIDTNYFIIMMGDLSDDPQDLPKIMEKLKDGYQVVFGSRFIKGSYLQDYPPTKFIANRLTNLVISVLFRIKSHDITGAFTGYQSRYFKNTTFKSTGFSILIELPIKGKLSGLKYCEVPVTWRNRIEGQSSMRLLRAGRNYWRIILELFFSQFFNKKVANQK
ncbi:MAG: glycosyltransferase [Candidatus Hermodarchaeota archaeon]